MSNLRHFLTGGLILTFLLFCSVIVRADGAIESGGTLVSGSYTLTNKSLDTPLSISGVVTITLSGDNAIAIADPQQADDGTGGVVGIYVADGASLTILGDGSLTVTATNSGDIKASGIYNEAGGTIILKGGTLTVTGTHTGGKQGFGVYNKGEFRVEGGSLLFGVSTTADFDNSETGVASPANVKFIVTGGKVAGETVSKPKFAGSVATIIDIAANTDVDISIPLLEAAPYAGVVAPYYTISTNLTNWTAVSGSVVSLEGLNLGQKATTPAGTPWGEVEFDNITHFILINTSTGAIAAVVPTYTGAEAISFTAPSAGTYRVQTRFQITKAASNAYYLTKTIGELVVTSAPAAVVTPVNGSSSTLSAISPATFTGTAGEYTFTATLESGIRNGGVFSYAYSPDLTPAPVVESAVYNYSTGAYTITLSGITESSTVTVSYEPPAPTYVSFYGYTNTPGVSTGNNSATIQTGTDYTFYVTVGESITSLHGLDSSKYQFYIIYTGRYEAPSWSVGTAVVGSSSITYPVTVWFNPGQDWGGSYSLRLDCFLRGEGYTVAVHSGSGITIEPGKFFGKSTEGTYSFEVTVSESILSAHGGLHVRGEASVYSQPPPYVSSRAVAGVPGKYIVEVSEIKDDVEIEVSYGIVWPSYSVISSTAGIGANQSGEAYNHKASFWVYVPSSQYRSDGVLTFSYTLGGVPVFGPEATYESPSVGESWMYYYVTVSKIDYDLAGVAIVVSYDVPAGLGQRPPVYIVPEPDIVSAINSSSSGSVLVASKSVDGVWDTSIDRSYASSGALVPGECIESIIPISIPAGATFPSPVPVTINFSGALSSIASSIDIPNVKVSTSAIKLVYIFESSLRSRLSSGALRAVGRDRIWGEYVGGIIYIHLVDIDVSSLSGSTEASLSVLSDGRDIDLGHTSRSVVLYDNPIDLIPDNGVPDVGDVGYFRLDGVYPVDGQLRYRLSNDASYHPYTIGLSLSEISRLASGELLYFTLAGRTTDPSSAGVPSALFIYLPNTYPDLPGGGVLPPIARAVTIRSTSGKLITSGLTTSETFTFTFTPLELLPNGEFTFTYTRGDVPVSNPPVLLNPSPVPVDGVYTFTLTNIKVSDLIVTLDYRQSTATNVIGLPSVWSSGSTLYISSPVSGVAKVYNVAGALMTTVSYGADVTSVTSLRAGIYIMVLGDGSRYKAIISK